MRLSEFAPPGGDDREPNEEEILRQLASRWWLGTEQQMAQAQKILDAMGWEIGPVESGDDDAGVFLVRPGDENGDSYIAFNHSDLSLDEAKKKKKSSRSLRGYFFPGYAYYGGGDSGEGGGDGGGESIHRGVAEGPDDSDDYYSLPQPYGDREEEFPMAQDTGFDVDDEYDDEQGMAEGKKKSEPPEADYGDDYQDMVARVKKLAGMGPLKTVYDPQKRVYKNVPVAVQPAQQPKKERQ